MKTVLVGINAKFIHANLAIRYLSEYVKEDGYEVRCLEYTINQSLDFILADIFNYKPQILGFSCYIWNIEVVLKLIRDYKKIAPKTKIILGGPEVSYVSSRILNEYMEVDYIVVGEGEETFKELLAYINGANITLDRVKGLGYRNDKNQVAINQVRQHINMDRLPFVYKNKLEVYKNRIIYYETSRGCPFSCGYCLSSTEKGVNFRSIDLVKKDLQVFLEQKVKQVKFVDRTFNCNKNHCKEIWEYLDKNDNGVTNFHFEIAAHLLDEETIRFLSTVREGLFQFEIGVQSTNNDTIAVVTRQTNFTNIAHNVRLLKSNNNIHLHLDLIAGLPKEGYDSFKKSFNDVYLLQPEKLQLGFLKVLKGSNMDHNSEVFGIHYRYYPPYEVLFTNEISYEEIQRLKLVEEMVEIYYNSGNYTNSIRYLETLFNKPFDLYESLADYYRGNYNLSHKHSKLSQYTILKEFSEGIKGSHIELMIELLKLDLMLQEKLKKYPEWIKVNDEYKEEIVAFYNKPENIERFLHELKAYTPKQISRMAHIEVFNYNVYDIIRNDKIEVLEQKTILLFNYYDRDKMRHNARIYSIDLK